MRKSNPQPPLLPSYRNETGKHWAGAGHRAAGCGARGGRAHEREHGDSAKCAGDECACGSNGCGWRGSRANGGTGRGEDRRRRDARCGRISAAIWPRGRDFMAGSDRLVFSDLCAGFCVAGDVACARELLARAGALEVPCLHGSYAGFSLPGRELVLAGFEEVRRYFLGRAVVRMARSSSRWGSERPATFRILRTPACVTRSRIPLRSAQVE